MMVGVLKSMRHYVHINIDGSIHVTNAVAGMIGQHHVHTKDGFQIWEPVGEVITLRHGLDCGCGLRPGEVKEGF